MKARADSFSTPVATKISAQIKELLDAGITDRGWFRLDPSKTTQGFAKAVFHEPKGNISVSFLKELTDEKTVALQNQLYRTEQALNCRDQLVAELVKEGCKPGRAEKLAEALVKLGVPFDAHNWSIGKRRVAVAEDKVAAKSDLRRMAQAAYDNLSKLLVDLGPGGSYKAVSREVREVFENLLEGLAKTINATPDDVTTDTDEAKRPRGNATTATTTSTTTTTGTTGITTTAAATAAKNQASTAQSTSPSTQPALTNVEAIDAKIQMLEVSKEADWKTIERFLAATDGVTQKQFNNAVLGVKSSSAHIERLQITKAKLIAGGAATTTMASPRTTAIAARNSALTAPTDPRGPRSKIAILNAQIQAEVRSRDKAARTMQTYWEGHTSNVTAEQLDVAETSHQASRIEITRLEELKENAIKSSAATGVSTPTNT